MAKKSSLFKAVTTILTTSLLALSVTAGVVVGKALKQQHDEESQNNPDDPTNPDNQEPKAVGSVTKTESFGVLDEYTITYEDGTTSTFIVSNGDDGVPNVIKFPGPDGKTPEVVIGENGNWIVNGVDTGLVAEGPEGINIDDIIDDIPQGPAGQDGKSAYEIAVAHGYTGTEEEWLASLIGEAGASGTIGQDGKSAYELAVLHGYTGTEEEWLESLVGPAGAAGVGSDGKSAYELAVEEGFVGSLAEWLVSLVGHNGENGKSAYDLAVEGGYTGTVSEWLESLAGEAGEAGQDGKSAYDIAVEQGFTGTKDEWLQSLVGATGDDGKSAYEIAVEQGFVGTVAEWLNSLKGEQGEQGLSLLTGHGVPDDETLGRAGDSYIDLDTYNYYVKGAAGWGEAVGNLKGNQGTAGHSVLSGASNPTDEMVGNVGDLYVNTNTGDIFKMTADGWQLQSNIQGPQGQQGNAGTAVLTGHGIPNDETLGQVGDSYIDLDTWNYYVKEDAGWGEAVGNIQGGTGAAGHAPVVEIDPVTGNWVIDGTDTGIHAQGEQGTDGAAVLSGDVDPTNETVANVGDLYINTTSGDIFKLVAEEDWQVQGNIMGQEGQQGQQGNPGENGTSLITGDRDPRAVDDNPSTPEDETVAAVIGIEGDSYLNLNTYDYYVLEKDGEDNLVWTLKGNVKGDAGHTPVVEIGANGNWVIDGTDTGIHAQGEQGNQGVQGLSVLTGHGNPNAVEDDPATPDDETQAAFPGQVGDSYIDLDSYDYYVLTDTGWGAAVGNLKGDAGQQGEQGLSLLTGHRDPRAVNDDPSTPDDESQAAVEARVGESYLDLDTWNYYLMTNSGWEYQGNVQGPRGTQLSTGNRVPTAIDDDPTTTETNEAQDAIEGIEGDSYINLDNYDFYVLEKDGENLVWTLKGNLGAQQDQHTVTFNGNGGTSSVTDATVDGIGLVAAPVDPTYEGFYFDGWYTQDGHKWDFDKDVVVEDVTLVAHWSKYKVENGVLVGCKATGDVNIPAVHNGQVITAIGSNVFKDDVEGWDNTALITSVNLPATVQTINASAFEGCTALTAVKLPNSVKSIGDNAFKGCTGLAYASLNDGLESIGESAFEGCTGLKSVVIPDTVTSIGASAFKSTDALTTIVLPFIGNDALQTADAKFADIFGVEPAGMSADLTTVMLTGGNGLNRDTVPENAFKGCKNLTTIVIPDEIDTNVSTAVPSSRAQLRGGIKVLGNSAFEGCTGLKVISLPNSLTTVGDYAFKGCLSLKNLVIPNNVTSIGKEILAGGNYQLSLLEHIHVDNVYYQTWDSPNSNETDTSYWIQVDSIYDVAGQEGDYLLQFSNGGSYEYYYLYQRTSYDEWEYITSWSPDYEKSILTWDQSEIDDHADEQLIAFVNMVVENDYNIISDSRDVDLYTVEQAKIELDSLVVPFIGEKADNPTNKSFAYFFGGSDYRTVPKTLGNVTITGDVAIPNNAFSYISSIESINFTGNITSIGDYAFRGCSNLRSFVVPGSVTTIGKYAFQDCGRLANVTLSYGLTSISTYAFYKCGGLTSIVIPDSVTSIGTWAFAYNENLKVVLLSKNLKTLSDYAFLNCSSLESIILPDALEQIGQSCFSSCNLSYVNIPSRVTTIGTSAFYGNNLKAIEIPETVTTIGNKIINNNKELLSLTITCKESTLTSTFINQFDTGNVIGLITIKGCPETIATNAFKTFKVKNLVFENKLEYDDDIGEDVECGVKTISSNAFSNNTYIESVTGLAYLNRIDERAFTSCSNLKTVDASHATELGEFVFAYCPELKTITLSDELETIPIYAFTRSGLESIIIPDSVTSIGSNAFSESNLITADLSNCQITELSKSMFNSCRQLTSVELPDSLETIGDEAFRYCVSLTKFELPYNVQTIGKSVFQHCDNLVEVDFDNYTLESIGETVFQYCYALTSIKTPFVGANPTSDKGISYFFSTSIFSDWSAYSLKLVEITGDTIQKQAFYRAESIEYVIATNVYEIKEQAFSNCTSLKQVSIPNVSEYGNHAFSYCESLETFNLYDLSSLGDYAFYNCKNLRNVFFSGYGSTIGKHAFEQCINLTAVNLDGVQTIGEFAFSDCTSLANVSFSDYLEEIGSAAFYDAAIRNIVIPDTVTTFGNNTFGNCPIESIILPFVGNFYLRINSSKDHLRVVVVTGNTDIKSSSFSGYEALETIVFKGNVLSVGDQAFQNCSSLTSIVIPSGCQTIGTGAFYGCSSLKSISIPNTVTSIGKGAFEECNNLEILEVPFIGEGTESNYFIGYMFGVSTATGQEQWYAPKLHTLIINGDKDIGANDNSHAYAVADYNSLETLIITGHVQTIGQNAFSSCDNLTKVAIASGTVTIGNSAFSTCPIESISLPNTVTTIGNSAFRLGKFGQINLYKVETIGANAFELCVKLADISSAVNVVTIGDSAFYGCDSLSAVSFPDHLTSIGEQAFYECANLAYVYFDTDAQASIGSSAFKKCYSLTYLYLGSKITTIGSSAFYECYSLDDVSIPNSVTSIGQYAFESCTSLKTLKIPFIGGSYTTSTVMSYAFGRDASLKTVTVSYGSGTDKNAITLGAFEGYSNIEKIVLPNNIASIGERAFKGCSSLKSINISDDLTTLGVSAFEGCESLISIALPSGLTAIGNNAFKGCTSLKAVNLQGDDIVVGEYAFVDCTSLKDINLLKIKEFNDYAFANCTSLVSIELAGPIETDIYRGAFQGCTGLTTVVVSNNAHGIYHGVFEDCNNIQYLSVPFLSSTLGNDSSYLGRLFGSMNATNHATVVPESLKTVCITGGDTSIGENAFKGCHDIEVVYLTGDDFTTVGQDAFNGLAGLRSVYILGSSFTTIEEGAFQNCSNLEYFNVTVAPETIGSNAFDCCVELRGFNFANAQTIGDNAFFHCYQLKEVYCQTAVSNIGASAFEGCSGLTSVRAIGSDLTIGASAFEGCTSLTSAYFNDLQQIGTDTFANCYSLTSAQLYGSLMSLASGTFAHCYSLTSVVFDESSSVSQFAIPTKAFEDCKSLTNIVLPNYVTTIDSGAFKGCDNLVSMTLPFVGYTANPSSSTDGELGFIFDGDAPMSLKTVIVSGNLTALQTSAFAGCSYLEEVYFLGSLTTVGDNAFENCYSLRRVALGTGLAKMGDYAFVYCSSLITVDIPTTSTPQKVVWGTNVFEDCSSLTALYLGYIKFADDHDNLVLPDYTFQYCGSLSSITLNPEIETIGVGAFAGCRSLTTIKLPTALKTIGETAFDGCASLTSLYIPNNVEAIGNYAFSDCLGLTTINFSITKFTAANSIGEGAFNHCDCLATVIVRDITGADIVTKRDNYIAWYASSAVSSTGNEALECLTAAASGYRSCAQFIFK